MDGGDKERRWLQMVAVEVEVDMPNRVARGSLVSAGKRSARAESVALQLQPWPSCGFQHIHNYLDILSELYLLCIVSLGAPCVKVGVGQRVLRSEKLVVRAYNTATNSIPRIPELICQRFADKDRKADQLRVVSHSQ